MSKNNPKTLSNEAFQYIFESLIDRRSVLDDHLQNADKDELAEFGIAWQEELALIELSLNELQKK